jgi:hypothetical protein
LVLTVSSVPGGSLRRQRPEFLHVFAAFGFAVVG